MKKLNPFSQKLTALRLQKARSQKAVALGINVSPTYLSAIEAGRKTVAARGLQEFVVRIAAELGLSETEIAELRQAAAESRRTVKMPRRAEVEEYRLVSQLLNKIELGALAPAQVTALQAVLEIQSQ